MYQKKTIHVKKVQLIKFIFWEDYQPKKYVLKMLCWVILLLHLFVVARCQFRDFLVPSNFRVNSWLTCGVFRPRRRWPSTFLRVIPIERKSTSERSDFTTNDIWKNTRNYFSRSFRCEITNPIFRLSLTSSSLLTLLHKKCQNLNN